MQCNDFRNGKTFFFKMKNLCFLSPCLWHLKLQKADNSVGKQALITKHLFLKLILVKNPDYSKFRYYQNLSLFPEY